MSEKLCAAAFILCAVNSVASAQSSVASFWGSSANLQVGSSMAEVGDLNGDGYVDMVVGAPHPGGVGAIYFVSGKYLETGSGPSTLGATFSPLTNSLFGTAVANVGDITGDGINDVVVGEPGIGAPADGRICVVSGASKSILNALTLPDSTFGASLSRCGDVDGDGYIDVMVGAPTAASGNPSVEVLSPRKFINAGPFLLWTIVGSVGGFRSAVSAGDIDHDGQNEYVVGSPNEWSVFVYEQGLNTVKETVSYPSGTGLGTALDASRDFDHDGYADIVAGAPHAELVFLISGANVTAGSGVQHVLLVSIAHWSNGVDQSAYGSRLTTTPDMNADGMPDIVIGAPLFDRVFPAATDCGVIYIISGDTLKQIGSEIGESSGERLGSSLSRSWDYDNDGRYEIAAGAPLSNHGATDGGIVRFYSLFPAAPSWYCAGKLNSQGCTPAIHYNTAFPSLSSPSPCNITVTEMINNKPGMLLYGYYPDSAVFQGGTLCVKSPIKRVGVQNTLGNPPPNDCSGTMTYDFNARIQSGVDAGLAMHGQEVFCQYWARDPSAVNGSALSDALHLVINP